MSLRCKFSGHTWKTVAIDHGHKFYFVKDPDTALNHIIMFQMCKHCDQRRMTYDEGEKMGSDYGIGS